MNDSQSRPRFWTVLLVALTAVVVLVAGADLLRAWVHAGLRDEVRVKVIEVRPEAVEAYLREQEGILHEPAWVDAGAGRVRVPIERAMDLVAGEAER